MQGKEDEINCKHIFAYHLIVENEEFDFDRVRNLWSLGTIGINPNNEVPLSDKQILKSFEQNTMYTNKRYETRLLWKEDSREIKSIPKDYTGEDVTPKNFMAVLKGDEKTLAGVGSGKVRKSGPSDHVFVYFTDHGAPGLIAFPEDELSAMDLN
ncbi:legumain [Trichonephila clavipes]|uniref:Legumain n=1 Tax=Trichonephila clavipes TaxID=2585209 RepID=A0A8X6RGX6_TRICX|nr:legumain [Trichonephila clavipes]